MTRQRIDLSHQKEYLRSFLLDFGYDEGGRNALLSAFDEAFAQKRCVRLYERIRKRYARAPMQRFRFVREGAERISAESGINLYTSYLLTLILLSEESKGVYREKGLSEELWRRNFCDLKYTCDQCLPMKGVYGTYCPDWYAGFFRATRFAFGILQFEIDPLRRDYQGHGVSLAKGAPVVYVHVPRTGKKLTPAAVDEACAEAAEFFRERFAFSPVVFACHSWLLYPENESMLAEGSNLLAFYRRFEIIDVEEDVTYHDLWRLFDMDYRGDPDELPRDSSLRRAYADRVRAGLPLGCGLGVWVYENGTPPAEVKNV